MLFEKIFQRDDKSFLLLYYIFLGIVLYFCSLLSYFIRNDTWEFSDIYFEGTILSIVVFLVLAILTNKETRYIKGTAQWLRVEFILLTKTFVFVLIITALFKITDSYSRIWFFTFITLSFILFLIAKVIFDFFYARLVSSNTIQRNILLIGDAESCQNIIKKFPKKISNSVIKCLIAIDQLDKKDTNYYGIPNFGLNENFGQILNHHSIGQVWIISSIKTQSYIESLIDKFLNFPVDCRLIQPESKFKFVEGLDSQAGFDFYNVSFSPFHGTGFLIKSLMDKFLALLFILISLPLIILFSILIVVEDGFPILFKQQRTGWDGKSFNIFKLRSIKNTMKGSESTQVKAGDNRLLKVGKIINKEQIIIIGKEIIIKKSDSNLSIKVFNKKLVP